MLDLARLKDLDVRSFGIQPSANIDATFEVAWQGEKSDLGLSEQLYTARGS